MFEKLGGIHRHAPPHAPHIDTTQNSERNSVLTLPPFVEVYKKRSVPKMECSFEYFKVHLFAAEKCQKDKKHNFQYGNYENPKKYQNTYVRTSVKMRFKTRDIEARWKKGECRVRFSTTVDRVL